MRYLEDAAPNPDLPYGESMHSMLTLSMVLAIGIGIVLYAAGRHGKILWLKVWSVGLVISSLVYLLGDFAGYF